MFGIVPKALWDKQVPCDEHGRIELAHNCLLLAPLRGGERKPSILIETGSGDKFDAKSKTIFGLTDYTILDALKDHDTHPDEIAHVIVTHLHFDHAGGLTRRGESGPVPTFPNATLHVQRREWEDAVTNRSVMTRTYLPENRAGLEKQLNLLQSPPPFPIGHLPQRDELPATLLADREKEILPGVFVFLTPGHTWGQQAVRFTDDRDRTIVFTPDILPTIHHAGAAYNMAYDVEPFASTVNRRWFLHEAAERDWLLVLVHEPGNPLVRVRADGKEWFSLIEENE
jgi:glyoxylase-like metal-dependent hydrolase (beta-lactamase superfamily II)